MHLLYSRFFMRVLQRPGPGRLPRAVQAAVQPGRGPRARTASACPRATATWSIRTSTSTRSGADAVRGWLAFLGPWDQGGPINDERAGRDPGPAARHLEPGARRRARRRPAARPTRTCGARCTRAIKGIGQDIEGFRFNTMVSKLMILRNELKRAPGRQAASSEAGTRRSARSCCWRRRSFRTWPRSCGPKCSGWPYSIHQQRWPAYDEALLVQVAGDDGGPGQRQGARSGGPRRRRRARRGAGARAGARATAHQAAHWRGHGPEVIVVPGKLVNIVAQLREFCRPAADKTRLRLPRPKSASRSTRRVEWLSQTSSRLLGRTSVGRLARAQDRCATVARTLRSTSARRHGPALMSASSSLAQARIEQGARSVRSIWRAALSRS